MMLTELSRIELERAARPLADAWTLPSVAYTHQSVFDDELKQIFHKDWQCVARAEQLREKGDYVCSEVGSQPIVVVKVDNDEIRALSSVCLHRAMPVVEGAGNATRFVCPYHKWTYELSGQLRSAPMMQEVNDFDREGCSLPTLRVEIWLGFVFVSLDGDCNALGPQLEGLAQTFAPYGLAELAVVETVTYPSPWNWKILVENFMEAYHHIGPHSQTFEPSYPARASYVDGDTAWSVLHMPAKNGEEDSESKLLAAVVYPNFLLAASGSGVVWYELQVKGHDDMQLKIHLLANPEQYSALSDEEKAEQVGMLRVVHEEDITVNQGPWRGLNAPLSQQGRLSNYEEAIWRLNQYWLSRLDCESPGENA